MVSDWVEETNDGAFNLEPKRQTIAAGNSSDKWLYMMIMIMIIICTKTSGFRDSCWKCKRLLWFPQLVKGRTTSNDWLMFMFYCPMLRKNWAQLMQDLQINENGWIDPLHADWLLMCVSGTRGHGPTAWDCASSLDFAFTGSDLRQRMPKNASEALVTGQSGRCPKHLEDKSCGERAQRPKI